MDEERRQIYRTLEGKVRKTPLYEFKGSKIPNNNRIFAKEEFRNPTGSVFDRLYPFLFRIAEESGYIIPGITPVIEQSGGNAGASFAWCARELGYTDCTVIMLPYTPKARIEHVRKLGAKVIFSERDHVVGNIRLLERLLQEDRTMKGGKIGENPDRLYCVTKIHSQAHLSPGYMHLAEEIKKDLEGSENIDYFVSGVGSGTTLKGIGSRLREIFPEVKLIAIEPIESPTTKQIKDCEVPKESMEDPSRNYQLFGLGTGLPRDKLNLPLDLIDDIILVSNNDWQEAYKTIAEQEGKSEVGRVSAATFFASMQIAGKITNKNILALFSDPMWKFADDYSGFK